MGSPVGITEDDRGGCPSLPTPPLHGPVRGQQAAFLSWDFLPESPRATVRAQHEQLWPHVPCNLQLCQQQPPFFQCDFFCFTSRVLQSSAWGWFCCNFLGSKE